jgi:hypothetical protein
MGITLEGNKEILGYRAYPTESANNWAIILEDPKHEDLRKRFSLSRMASRESVTPSIGFIQLPTTRHVGSIWPETSHKWFVPETVSKSWMT